MHYILDTDYSSNDFTAALWGDITTFEERPPWQYEYRCRITPGLPSHRGQLLPRLRPRSRPDPSLPVARRCSALPSSHTWGRRSATRALDASGVCSSTRVTFSATRSPTAPGPCWTSSSWRPAPSTSSVSSAESAAVSCLHITTPPTSAVRPSARTGVGRASLHRDRTSVAESVRQHPSPSRSQRDLPMDTGSAHRLSARAGSRGRGCHRPVTLLRLLHRSEHRKEEVFPREQVRAVSWSTAGDGQAFQLSTSLTTRRRPRYWPLVGNPRHWALVEICVTDHSSESSSLTTRRNLRHWSPVEVYVTDQASKSTSLNTRQNLRYWALVGVYVTARSSKSTELTAHPNLHIWLVWSEKLLSVVLRSKTYSHENSSCTFHAAVL